MASQSNAEGKVFWANAEQRQTLNEWMDHIEETEGFEPNPGQAVQSACKIALEVEA